MAGHSVSIKSAIKIALIEVICYTFPDLTGVVKIIVLAVTQKKTSSYKISSLESLLHISYMVWHPIFSVCFTKPDLCFNLTPVSKRKEGIKSLSQACSQRHMRSLPLSVARYVWSVQSLYKTGQSCRKCLVFVGSENELISTFKWASFLVFRGISLNVQSQLLCY